MRRGLNDQDLPTETPSQQVRYFQCTKTWQHTHHDAFSNTLICTHMYLCLPSQKHNKVQFTSDPDEEWFKRLRVTLWAEWTNYDASDDDPLLWAPPQCTSLTSDPLKGSVDWEGLSCAVNVTAESQSSFVICLSSTSGWGNYTPVTTLLWFCPLRSSLVTMCPVNALFWCWCIQIGQSIEAKPRCRVVNWHLILVKNNTAISLFTYLRPVAPKSLTGIPNASLHDLQTSA